MIRTIVFGGLDWGPPILGNYHMMKYIKGFPGLGNKLEIPSQQPRKNVKVCLSPADGGCPYVLLPRSVRV